ncbi:MAG: hypothetical protein IPP00_08305 [Actinomycetales bacterium]|uniref:Uncharacterized protein n=1 Tax=Candidatus Phosphoribacter hodrii TaxID=2953743 RepID=A0A9D7XWR9_9MICO|nr:hypothetical protein [Candidatus Phosphoribacter hodrii]
MPPSCLGTGADGTRIEADLIARRMPVELADRDTLVAMVTSPTPHNVASARGRPLPSSSRPTAAYSRPTVASIAWSVAPQHVCLPRAAFFARQETVAAKLAPSGGRAVSWWRPIHSAYRCWLRAS